MAVRIEPVNKLRSWLPISLVVFCVIAFFADAQQGKGECSSLSTTFYTYDINVLEDQNFSVPYDEGFVYFSICTENRHALSCPSGASVCIQPTDAADDVLVSGGALDTQKMTITGDDSLQIVYTAGSTCSYTSTWATVISIQCGAQTQVISAQASACTMNIDILSPAACHKQKSWIVPVLVVCAAILVLLALYPFFLFLRRLSRPRTVAIRPASPEEILPLLSPSPSTPSLFINDYIFTSDSVHKKLADSPPGARFLLDPPSPETATKLSTSAESCADPNPDPEKGMCKICWARTVDCALVDCGHLTCIECAANMLTCPFCRRKVITRIKLYYS